MLRKAMLLGLGALTMTKETLEKTVDELVKKGELNQGEAKEALRDLWEKGQQERDNLAKMVREQVDKAMQAFTGVSRDEFAAVKSRVAALEAKLAAQEMKKKEQDQGQSKIDPNEGKEE